MFLIFNQGQILTLLDSVPILGENIWLERVLVLQRVHSCLCFSIPGDILERLDSIWCQCEVYFRKYLSCLKYLVAMGSSTKHIPVSSYFSVSSEILTMSDCSPISVSIGVILFGDNLRRRH